MCYGEIKFLAMTYQVWVEAPVDHPLGLQSNRELVIRGFWTLSETDRQRVLLERAFMFL